MCCDKLTHPDSRSWLILLQGAQHAKPLTNLLVQSQSAPPIRIVEAAVMHQESITSNSVGYNAGKLSDMRNMEFLMAVQRSVLTRLLQQLALPAEDWLPRTLVAGEDPVVPSRYRTGLASATALSAMAVGIGEIWRQRGGGMQDIRISLRKAAVPGLRTLAYVKRDGHALQLARPASESQVFFETRDGRQMYLLRHAFYHEHYNRLLARLDCSSATDSIARAVARWDALELEDALAQVKAMATIARTRDEWLAHPQGVYLASRTPVEIEQMGPSNPEPMRPAERPLAGLKVVDMGHVLAGPIVSRCLAEQGADVLHVSAPHLPDPNHIDPG